MSERREVEYCEYCNYKKELADYKASNYDPAESIRLNGEIVKLKEEIAELRQAIKLLISFLPDDWSMPLRRREMTESTKRCVLIDGDFAIVYCTALFGNGFNVYKAIAPDSVEFVKINNRMTFFTSLDAAKEWLANYKNSVGT